MLIARRHGIPAITIKAAVVGPTQPAAIVQQLEPEVAEFDNALPAGDQVELGGSVELSAESEDPITAVALLILLAIASILMIELQSLSRLFLMFAVAPLALIGVVAALLLFNASMGFVAIFGVFALVGTLIRKSVIRIKSLAGARAFHWRGRGHRRRHEAWFPLDSGSASAKRE